MSTLALPTRRRRPLALTVALVGGLLATLPATPASAAPTGSVTSGTATWGTSTYLASGNPGRPAPYAAGYVAPATYDSVTKLSSWGTATGSVAANGSATLEFDGTSVNHATTSGHWIKLADLVATVDTAGNGKVTAQVTYGVASGPAGAIPYDDSTPTRSARVDLVTLAGNTPGDRSATATQTTWTGLDGAWAPAFLDFIDGDSTADPAVPAFAYYTQINSNTDRTPLPFTFTVNKVAPAVTATATGASYAQGVTVGVTGTGFSPTDGNPGDDGVYAGLAPSGGLPDVSSQAAMANFAGANYVPGAAIVNGSMSTTVNAPTEELDQTKSYSLYTWRAHSYSTQSQNTETPVTINWAALAPSAGVITPAGAATRTYGATSTLTATVNGPGSVTLTGVGAAQTKAVSAGAVSFAVPASLAVGTHTASFAYSGGGGFSPATATRALTVEKATPALGGAWKKKPTVKKRGKLKVVATGPAGATAPTGDVLVKVSRQGESSTFVVTLVDGQALLKLPKLSAGTWKIKLTYLGAPSYHGAKAKLKVVVRPSRTS